LDAVLERLAMEHGSRHWRRVAAQMPRHSSRRSPAQCCDRWRDHLARDVFHRPFTADDDAELALLCLRLDDGRSSRAVKRRWRELRKSDAFLGKQAVASSPVALSSLWMRSGVASTSDYRRRREIRSTRAR
jgi:hypothetical protein